MLPMMDSSRAARDLERMLPFLRVPINNPYTFLPTESFFIGTQSSICYEINSDSPNELMYIPLVRMLNMPYLPIRCLDLVWDLVMMRLTAGPVMFTVEME